MVGALGISDPTDIILEVGRIGKWVQAVGLLVIAWIVIQISNYMINRKRMKKIEKFDEDIKRIEGKVDRILIMKSRK